MLLHPPHHSAKLEFKRRSNMKSGVSKTFTAAAGGLLAGVLVLAAVMPAGAQSEQSPNGLEGTWRVQVVQYNCANPSITFPPFYSLLSFHRGGTETETTSNPALQPGQRTSGYGFWKPVGDHQYLMAVEAFILFDSPTTPPGLKTGTQKIVQAVMVTDDNHFATDGTVNFFATDGTNYRSGCAKSYGTRLTADNQP
jgi:hypothetical protein